MEKKLCLSSTNKMIAGVCGGIAEYFKVDATFVRIIFAILTLLTYGAPFAIIYIICWAVMPLSED
ncbi:MAG: PspC domain-containing protein [Clostridiales bacterium]|jgi:phage shock protein C|nr:PspC domain-containing protein [Clostridiales bacterium]